MTLNTNLATRSLGKNGPVVSALGLGCKAMSEFYGRSNSDEALNIIAAALDAGVSLFDTGDFYGMGDNEILLGEALRGQREKAFIQLDTSKNLACLARDVIPSACGWRLCRCEVRLGSSTSTSA